MRFHKLEEHALNFWPLKTQGPLLSLLRNSQKFYFGDVGVVPDNQISIKDFPKLPFKKCAFEFSISDTPLPDGFEQKPLNVICLAEDFSKNEDIRILFDFFISYGIKNPEKHEWGYCGDVTLSANSIGLLRLRKDDGQLISGIITRKKINKMSSDELLPCLTFWVGAFLRVLNCTNVVIQNIDAPKFLNKKRAQKGRPSIYSYKTLVLKTKQRRLEQGNGTHESPRIHLRRGHIKKRKTGDFWWQPCVVGNVKRGIVMKDYRADKLLQEQQ